MKYLKKILIIFGCLIGFIILVLIIDIIRLTISYNINKDKYVDQFDVQGNTSNYVPQGLAYSEKYNVALQTSYNSKHDCSKLYITDFSSGKLLKELKLIETDGSDNTKHVGGIATNNDTVWITNDYEVNEYSLEEIMNTNEDYIKSLKNTKLPIRGDFCNYKDDVLWIGDFFLNPFYKVPNDNPLVMAYNLDKELNYFEPDCIISLPKMVQGMAITSNNEFVFTSSFTNLIHSNLSIYKNVLDGEYEYYNLNGKDIPYYKFNDSNLIKKIKLPPMAEGLFIKDNEMYILFENSADKYFYAFPKMRKVIKMKY